MAVTDVFAKPIIGGEVGAWFGTQPAVDSTHPLAKPLTVASSLASYTLNGGSAPLVYFMDVPQIDPGVQMDNIYPLGSYIRVQRNAIDYAPTCQFEIDLQDISSLAMGIRPNGYPDGLPNYSMVFGNSSYQKIVSGMTCDSCEISIPIGGRASVKYNMLAGLVVPSAVTLPSVAYNADYSAFYGYELTFNYGGSDGYTYQKLIKRVTINVNNNLVRGPVELYNVGITLGSGPPLLYATTAGDLSSAGQASELVLVSSYIKPTTQVTSVSFELTNPLPISDVNQIMRTINSAQLILNNPNPAGVPTSAGATIIDININDLSFATQVQAEGGTQGILSFSATADADTIVITDS